MANFRIYNQMLCHHIWDEYQHLDPRVRVNLLRMAYDFYKKSKLPAPIIDIYLMGSIANYNWTPESDADVHVIIDYSKLQMPQETAFKTIKTVGSNWNLEHQVTVKGHKVEMNIQNLKEVKPHVTGIYSLIKDQWVRKPTYQNVQIDKPTVQIKYSGLKKYIESAMNSGDRETMKKAKDYIDAFRQYGLDTTGEMSYENIVFKILRAKGLIKALKDAITATYDREMTVREVEGNFPPNDGLSATGGFYWWLSPDLKFYSVRGMTHSGWAIYYVNNVLKKEVSNGSLAYNTLLDLGWIRVGMDELDNELFIEYLYKISPSRKTIKAIEDLGIERGAVNIRDDVTSQIRKLEIGETVKEALVKDIPKDESPYIIIGMTVGNDKTISGVTLDGHGTHANLPYREKKIEIIDPLIFWRYRSVDKTLYMAVAGTDPNYGIEEKTPIILKYLRHVYNITPKNIETDRDKYSEYGHALTDKNVELGDQPRMYEVTQKDIKSTLPDVVYDRSNVDLSRMTLDNLKAMRAKEARFFKHCQEIGDAANIEKSLIFYDELDWEIKRRLARINKSVEEGYGAGDPTTDPLHIPGERWRIKFGSRKTPMIKENKILTESMNVGIKGYSYDRKLNTLDGVSNHLLDKVLMPTINSLSPDQKAYFEKNRMGSVYDMLSPDGSYWQGPEKGTGIINLYISGFMTQTIQHLLKDMIRECRRLGITVGKLTKEQSGMYKSQVIRIPVVKNTGTYSGPPEINLSNRNAYHIFKNVLQFEPDDDSGSSFSFKTQDLIDSIMSIKGDKSWVKQHGIATKKTEPKKPKEPIVPGDEWKYQDEPPEPEEPEEPEPENPHNKIANQIGAAMGGPQMISFGLMPEDIQQRLDLILSIAQWAKAHGYTEMYVA